MKAITVRDVPKEVRAMIEERARSKGLSLTRATIDLLRERIREETSTSRAVEYHDLDALAGSWTRAEAERFEREARAHRSVDPDLWK